MEHKGLGKPAPTLTITDINGRALDANEYKGRVVVVNLWATWCAPCESETFALINLQKKYGDQLTIIALSVDEDPSVVRKFSEKFQINYRIAMLDRAADRAYGQLLDLPIRASLEATA
jgi:thiol-disulfide isomerase/thioredoxin